MRFILQPARQLCGSSHEDGMKTNHQGTLRKGLDAAMQSAESADCADFTDFTFVLNLRNRRNLRILFGRGWGRRYRRIASPARELLRAAGVCFEAVAVGIDNERGVVVLAVVRAQPRLAVVVAAGLERGRVERIHIGAL